ncbi:MAG: DUF4010 domain-containing protein [Pirellulales bacterium]|nr:DUF4010 domain-containing protein [Pirellulales bacterium]
MPHGLDQDPTPMFQHLGLALALGLLVGLQRERSGASLAGLRTFPLITVLGTLSATLAGIYGGWLIAAALLAVLGVILIGNLGPARQDDPSLGTTTEFAVLLMFIVGAYLAVGPWIVAVAVGAGVAVLLHLKPELHVLARRLTNEDFKAVMQFVLITCVVLPVVPNRPLIEHLHALNPYEVWLMVVLIVGISLAGYVAYRLFGQSAGVLLAGLLGGAISSTATTAGYSRRTARDPDGTAQAAVVIAIAAVTVFARVLGEMAVVSSRLAWAAAWPVALVLAAGAAPLAVGWLRLRGTAARLPEQANPTELKSALVFAALYGLVNLALAAAREYLHVEGLYLVAMLSGLTDMDAITLSTAQLVEGQRLEPAIGWRLVLTAGIANLVFKAGIVATLAPRTLLARVAGYFLAPLVAAAALIALWP